MNFDTGIDDYRKKSAFPQIPTGDPSLDKLLLGGVQRELIHLVYGPRNIITSILLKTSVNAQIILGENVNPKNQIKVAYIDGNNRFNPYEISKYAASKGLSPQKVLEQIIIARAFTWEQMIELVEHRLKNVSNISVVIISGFTQLFEYEKKGYEGLWKAIDGIKRTLSEMNPYIILTGPKHKYSLYKPEGGKIIQHFGNVLVLIDEDERKIMYRLIQHPSLPEETITKKKMRKSKKKSPVKNTKLDKWM